MNDRIPGSSYYNPIWYRDYRIYVGDPQESYKHTFLFTHKDYDGAPDANDSRHGAAVSEEAAKAAIDELEEE